MIPNRDAIRAPDTPTSSDAAAVRYGEERIERLIARLPHRLQTTVRWLRRPTSRRVRIPAGVLLICGGFLSILPVLGLWMLPLGLILLAEDVPPLRRARDRLLDYAERRLDYAEWRRPQWFACGGAEGRT